MTTNLTVRNHLQTVPDNEGYYCHYSHAGKCCQCVTENLDFQEEIAVFPSEVQRRVRFRAGGLILQKTLWFGGKTALQNQLQFMKHEIYKQIVRRTYRSVFYEKAGSARSILTDKSFCNSDQGTRTPCGCLQFIPKSQLYLKRDTLDWLDLQFSILGLESCLKISQ